MVTADGLRTTASETEHEDLFWALRGGGGNFGVVTSFEFRLSPIATVYGGPIFFELDNIRDVLRFYRDFIADAPEQYGGFPAFQIAPPLPFIPRGPGRRAVHRDGELLDRAAGAGRADHRRRCGRSRRRWPR